MTRSTTVGKRAAVPKLTALIALVLAVVGCASKAPAAPSLDPAVMAVVRSASPPLPRDVFLAYVVRVVDGDTVIARRGGHGPALRVRLVGVDTPETVRPGTPVRCYGHAASAFTTSLLSRQWVRAAYEPGPPHDRYGRELWDIWLSDGRFVAAMLAAGGFARAEPIAPQTVYAGLLARLVADAKSAGRGLWGPPCRGDAFG
jgi:micrococcal nuclease